MGVLRRLTNAYKSLTKSEQRVADYVQQDPAAIVVMPLQALASRCHTSDATVIRFCRSLGFSGYQDFKSALIPEVLNKAHALPVNAEDPAEFRSFTNNFRIALDRDIANTLSNLEESNVKKVARAIADSEGVIIAGLAGSAGVGRILADSLLSIGIAAQCISDRVELERATALLKPSQVLLGITHSGETEEVCAAIARARMQGALAVAITNFTPSRAQSSADITLLTCVAENVLGSYSCVPRIGELALFEVIVRLVVDAKRSETCHEGLSCL